MVALSSAFAQTDSTLQEIINFDSRSALISNARGMLLEKFLEGDMKKVKELDDYLTNKLSDNIYDGLFPNEQILIKYWTCDYENLIQVILSNDSIYKNNTLKVFPQSQEQMYVILFQKTKKESTLLINAIEKSQLSGEDKDFLKMYLPYFLLNHWLDHSTQIMLNTKADEFLSKYTGSKYEEFVRYKIREKYSLKNWGFGCAFFLGMGWYNGELQNRFGETGGIGFNIDATYKRVLMNFNGFWSSTGTKDSIMFHNINWKKDAQTDVILIGGNLGYFVANYKYFTFTPFIGLSSHSMKASDYSIKENPEYKNIRLKSNLTYNLGISTDIKVKNTFSSVAYNPEMFYTNIRIAYTYYISHFDQKYPGFSGNMHCLTIGFGVYVRNSKRVY